MFPTEIGPMLTRTPARLLVVVSLVAALLFSTTVVLARKYRAEKRFRAEQQFQAGERLYGEGHYDESIEQYAEALTLSRNNPTYRQALALALVKAGRTAEAEAYLKELLHGDPANGLANLMLARIYVAQGAIDDSLGYYQRAIYGLWPDDPAGQRISTRFELIELLQSQGEHLQMEAELLRLRGEIPEDPKLEKRIGHLFLAARSLQNAAAMFSSVVEKDRRDADAYAGLGDAEFEMAHYLSARTAYRQARRLKPGDLQSSTQLELVNGILDLDPMSRGLGSWERLRRSQELVARALSGLDYCLPAEPDEDAEKPVAPTAETGADTEAEPSQSVGIPEDFLSAIDEGRKLLKTRARQQRTNENVEANIILAERLEDLRRINCGASPVPDRALRLVLKKLAD